MNWTFRGLLLYANLHLPMISVPHTSMVPQTSIIKSQKRKSKNGLVLRIKRKWNKFKINYEQSIIRWHSDLSYFLMRWSKILILKMNLSEITVTHILLKVCRLQYIWALFSGYNNKIVLKTQKQVPWFMKFPMHNVKHKITSTVTLIAPMKSWIQNWNNRMPTITNIFVKIPYK